MSVTKTRAETLALFALAIAFVAIDVVLTGGLVELGTVGKASGHAITAAPYTYAISKLIFSVTIVLAIFQIFPPEEAKETLARLRSPVAVVFLTAIFSELAFAYVNHSVGAALTVMLFGASLWAAAFVREAKGVWTVLCVKAPVTILAGWLSVVACLHLLNLSVLLLGGAVRGTIIGAFWLTVLAVGGVWLRFSLNSTLFPLAVAWGIAGIAVRHSGSTLPVTISAFGVIALLFAALWGYVKDK